MDFNQVKRLFTLSNYENDSRYQQAVDTLVGIEKKAARDAGYPVFRFDRANSRIVLRRSSSQDFELTYSLDEWEQMEQKYLPMSNSEKEFAAFVRTFIGNEMYDKFPDSEPDVGTPLTEFPKGVPGWVRKYYRLRTRHSPYLRPRFAQFLRLYIRFLASCSRRHRVLRRPLRKRRVRLANARKKLPRRLRAGEPERRQNLLLG